MATKKTTKTSKGTKPVSKTASNPATKVGKPVQTQAKAVTPEVKQAVADSQVTETLPCLTNRRNKPEGFTCLDEMKEAIDHPGNFTKAQYDDIINENNLCANCQTNYESLQ